MRKHSRPCIIRFHKCWKLKSAEQYQLRLLQLYTPWIPESDLKHEDETYESKHKEVGNDVVENVIRYEPYLDIDFEELDSCKKGET